MQFRQKIFEDLARKYQDKYKQELKSRWREALDYGPNNILFSDYISTQKIPRQQWEEVLCDLPRC